MTARASDFGSFNLGEGMPTSGIIGFRLDGPSPIPPLFMSESIDHAFGLQPGDPGLEEFVAGVCRRVGATCPTVIRMRVLAPAPSPDDDDGFECVTADSLGDLALALRRADLAGQLIDDRERTAAVVADRLLVAFIAANRRWTASGQRIPVPSTEVQ